MKRLWYIGLSYLVLTLGCHIMAELKLASSFAEALAGVALIVALDALYHAKHVVNEKEPEGEDETKNPTD